MPASVESRKPASGGARKQSLTEAGPSLGCEC